MKKISAVLGDVTILLLALLAVLTVTVHIVQFSHGRETGLMLGIPIEQGSLPECAFVDSNNGRRSVSEEYVYRLGEASGFAKNGWLPIMNGQLGDKAPGLMEMENVEGYCSPNHPAFK